MTSMILNIFKDNFFALCIEDKFKSFNCITGSSSLFISILILILNFFAFFKLVNFYGKINFETNLIIFSIFQIIVIQLIIITSYELLIVFFTLIQIFIITLIIRKFVIISNQPNQILKKNGLFIFLNTINLLLFIIYILLLGNNTENSYSIILFHTCFYAFSSIILAFYSNSLIKLIKKVKQSEFQSSLLTQPFSKPTNAEEEKKKSTSQSTFEEDEKKESNSQSTKEEEEKKNNQNLKYNSIIIKSIGDITRKNEIFFIMRKKQIKPLYKINIICSFLEFLIILSINLSSNENFKKKDEYKISPTLLYGYIEFYLYIIICLFNVSVNFFCFFWKIKNQYNNDKNDLKNKKDNKRIIDNRYIRRETIIMEKENSEKINEFIENDDPKRDQKKMQKSFFYSSFTEITEEKEEDFYIKPTQKDNNKNNNSIIEINDNNNKDKDKDKMNNETYENKGLLEPLNSNYLERESIPCNLDSVSGINRNSSFNKSKIDQDI